MADLIDRQAAIEALKRAEAITRAFGYHNVIDTIRELPTAKPDMDEWCDDCKEYDHEKHCCPRFNRVIRTAMEEAKGEAE